MILCEDLTRLSTNRQTRCFQEQDGNDYVRRSDKTVCAIGEEGEGDNQKFEILEIQELGDLMDYKMTEFYIQRIFKRI